VSQLKRSDNDIVEAYWKMLSALSRTVKLKLASRLTNAVLEEELVEQKTSRKAKVVKRTGGQEYVNNIQNCYEIE